MKDATRIFKRYEEGPLLHIKDFPGKAQIYNPAPVQYGDETILLVSVVEHAATRGYGRDVGQTRIARSNDGINFVFFGIDSARVFKGVQGSDFKLLLS